jgi:hypothetical protein
MTAVDVGVVVVVVGVVVVVVVGVVVVVVVVVGVVVVVVVGVVVVVVVVFGGATWALAGATAAGAGAGLGPQAASSPTARSDSPLITPERIRRLAAVRPRPVPTMSGFGPVLRHLE